MSAHTGEATVPVLDTVHRLYQEGRCLQAFQAAEALGPLRTWTGTSARVMGGRLALNLGAPRLGFALHLRAWRTDPTDAEARYFYGRVLMDHRGPLRAWRFLKECGAELPNAPPAVQTDWLALHAAVLGQLRDFDAAEQWLARAEDLAPERPWICIERAHLFELEDRYAESLESARRALALRPWYRPGVQAVAHSLGLQGREREALDLLAEAEQHIENALVVLQRAELEAEMRLYDDAAKSYDRFIELAPLLEKKFGKWLAGRRADVAYYLGEHTHAIDYARQADAPFYTALADKLAAGTPVQRVLLDVGFVRQHYETCVPATLTTLARFWKLPAEHLAVAAEICYDGTPDHRERHWAETHGWSARDFTVTWDAARALIDRGVPFTLVTTEPGGGHMQAVIGYDATRNTLLLRDPYVRIVLEANATPLFERYRSIGPRGMALVPADRAHLLEGIDLPDAALYDQVYRLQRSLERHDRADAAAAVARLAELAPGHRLALMGRRLLAQYDANRIEVLDVLNELLKLYPDDQLLDLAKFYTLRDLARRDERLALLQARCAKPGCDPIFYRVLAQELLADAREHREALYLVRRALRYRPNDAGNLSARAGLYREERRFAEALELDRLAACLADKDEGLAQVYFWTARFLRQSDTVLRFLEQRFERLGPRSSQPARTLFWAYSQCERMPEAFAMLDKAQALRPDDADLTLYAAESHGLNGHPERAAQLLEACRGRVQGTAWQVTAARLAETRNDVPLALELWQQVLQADPLWVPAHAAAARLLAETQGRVAALEHLRGACGRFPFHAGLHQLHIEWLREDGGVALEPVVKAYVDIHPADAWGHRELALTYADLRRYDEAFAALEAARTLEPTTSTYFSVRGQVLEQAGRRLDAQEAYRQAIALSVDNEFASSRLLGACDTVPERRAAIAFLEGELTRQVVLGDGLWNFQRLAQGILAAPELLAILRQGLEARPDLWHAWSAVVAQLVEMGQGEEAHQLAQQATERFPLLPRLWLDLAQTCALRNDTAGREKALRQALEISPGWAPALRDLSRTQELAGDVPAARATLERAIAWAPLDPINHGCLAELLWNQGERDAALAAVTRAVRLDPGHEGGWRLLRGWAQELGRPEAGLELARELTATRGGEARSWLLLAEALTAPEQRDEALAALDRALELNPRSHTALDRKAELLTAAGRFDEAAAACRPEWFGAAAPFVLRGRLAWIEAQRGQLPQAIEQMQALVAEDPGYYWGWSNLGDWARATGNTPLYLEAGDAMVRLAPEGATAHGFRGEARFRHGDRPGAKADLRRALELAPDYGFAAMLLFDMHMGDGEWADAERCLTAMQKAHEDEFVIARAVQLHAGRDDGKADRKEALAAYRRLLVASNPETWPLEAATQALGQAGWSVDIEHEVATALDNPGAHPYVGELWAMAVPLSSQGIEGPVETQLGALLQRGPIGRKALDGVIRRLGEARAAWILNRWVRRFTGPLREDPVSWGNVGYALATAADYPATVTWLADWRQRAGVQPWMLMNLVIALRAQSQDAAAAEVSRHARTLPPDHTIHFHALWLAADAALAGDDAAAVELRAAAQAERLDETHRFLDALVGALLDLRQAAPAERGAAFAAVRARLAKAAEEATPLTSDRAAVAHMYRRFVRQLGREAGTWPATLWSWYRRLTPLLPSDQP